MMWLIDILKKRPSDNTIRLARIIFGLIIVLWWYYNLIYQNDSIQNNLFWIDINENIQTIIKYIVVLLWFIPLIMWITNLCLLKSKYIRITQIIFWILLFYISSLMESWAKLDFDTLIWFLWIFPLLAWITWKCITTKCTKYKEKITKVRV